MCTKKETGMRNQTLDYYDRTVRTCAEEGSWQTGFEPFGGMTWETEMGKLAGVSRQTISQIERGDYSPSVTLALKLAKICEVNVEDIFIYEEEINDEGKEK